jgi:hypothetical protein
MRRTSAFALVVLLVGLATLSACSVSFDGNSTGDGEFKCTTDDDCVGQDQTCQQHESGDYSVCTSTPPCIDQDGDGYGSPENETFETCSACEDGKPNGCEPDCADTPEQTPEGVDPASIHPGAIEQCDGVDNDCDASTGQENPIGFQECSSDSECPLVSAGGDISPPKPDTTQWTCEEIGGTSQCVLIGNFNGDPDCAEKSDMERYGTCNQDDEAGSIGWSEVPKVCRTGEAGDGG